MLSKCGIAKPCKLLIQKKIMPGFPHLKFCIGRGRAKDLCVCMLFTPRRALSILSVLLQHQPINKQ